MRPHGPHFPRQLVSPTHWITQEALLNMIEAIDADMHARPGDAEFTPWFLLLDCAPQHVPAELSQYLARILAAHQIVRRPADFHGTHSAAGQGVHARPPRGGGQTLRPVFLGSRVQLRTCQLTAAVPIRADSRTERRPNRWLALHRLERGGAG